jgi:mono/diheme cytochrome c family protein
MKKILKWIGIVIGGLVLLVVLVAGGMLVSTNLRFSKTYDIQPEPLAIPTDAESLAIGEYWVNIHCRDCHAPDLGGRTLLDDPMIGTVDTPNLTSGEGGIGASYTDADWVRALRHGVKKDGTSVFIMPSNHFYYLSDTDLAAIIAYVKSVPPVDRPTPEKNLKPMAKILYAAGAFGSQLHAETIDHDARPSAPPKGMTVEYGEYLVNAHGCRGCHGEALSGMQPPEPGSPLAPNLTPGGELLGWSEDDFINTIRTGLTPHGHELSEFMPWKYFRLLTDDDLKTIWLYLASLDALETTQ